MRPVARFLVLGLATSLLVGCSPGYRRIKRREVVSLNTPQGRAAMVGEVKYPALLDAIERLPRVKAASRLTELRGELEPGNFAVSLDGAWLVFQALATGASPPRWNLCRIATSGAAGAVRLTSGSCRDLEPAFSPDGSAIYFASDRASHLHRICRIRADGGAGIPRITHGDSEDRLPAVSPDRQTLYCTSRPFNANEYQLWRAEINGTLPTQLKEGWQPRISPDGRRVVYAARDPKTGNFKIWTMEVDTTNQTQLTSDPTSRDRDPAWPPPMVRRSSSPPTRARTRGATGTSTSGSWPPTARASRG